MVTRLPKPPTAAAPRRSLWRGRTFRLAALALAGLALASCALGRGMQTVSVLSDLSAGRLPEGVVRTQHPFSRNGRAHQADLYHPDGWQPASALVLVPGASPRGRDDPRLVAFAGTLANAGFSVLVPEIPALRRMTLSAGDARIIADALRQMADRQPHFLGVVAVSYAVGPAMLAAHEPASAGSGAAAEVDGLVGIGGYHDADAVATWFTTGWYRLPLSVPPDPDAPGRPGEWVQGRPGSYGKWVFLQANAHRVDDPADAALLAEMARRRLAAPDAAIADLVPRLGADGRAVHDFLSNTDRERAPALLAALPARIRGEMQALDLSRRDFSGAGPRLILVHGRNDPVIPAGESRALAAAVRGADGRSRAELHLVDGIGHVEAGGIGLGDALVLAEAVYSLLALRDRAD